MHKLILVLAFLAVSPFAEDPNAQFRPGKENKVTVFGKGIGANGFNIYIPPDYNSVTSWPAIFYYHGLGEKRSTDLIQSIVGKDKYVIIALDFVPAPAEMDKSQYVGYLQMEQRSLGAAKVYASKFVNIDIKKMVLVGVSKGGWLVANLSDINPKPWAGMVILNAGRNGVTNIKKDIKGKPVFVGAGESDQNLNVARKAAAYYEQAGADITFETFYGKGHEVDPNAVELRAFFDKIISSNPKKM